jgi:hypothetical protein
MHRTLTRWLAAASASLAAVTVLVLGAGSAQAVPTAGYVPSAGVKAPCAPASAGHASCAALLDTDRGHLAFSAGAASTTPSGLDPSELGTAYDLQTALGGSRQTVAVVTAYDDPDAESDLTTYRTQYGMPPCTTADGCFDKVNQTGGTSYPGTSTGWSAADAESMDMISALCRNCHILLVEASTYSVSDLGTAENEAVALGAKFIDNDWYSPEAGLGSAELTDDTEYFDHPGVAITAPAGDSGYGTIEYPAASQYITAVGGTTLTADSSAARGFTETAWAGSSSGCSAYEPKPSWQTDTGCSDRTLNDVSADADPTNSPIAYYDTPTTGGWGKGGGTLVAAAIVAAAYALSGTPASGSDPASYPYQHPGGDYTTPGDSYTSSDGLYNITSGSTGTCTPAYLCTAGAGYNGPTGLGTPASDVSFSATGNFTGAWFRGTGDLCIDDRSDATTNGNAVQSQGCNGTTAQEWTAESDGTFRHDGSYCLDVTNGGTTSGTLVQLWSCLAGDANQQWIPRGDRELYNPHSGLCLYDPVATSGTQLEIYTCNDANPEAWDLPYPVPTSTGEITSHIKAGECMDNLTGGTTNGNKIDIWTCNGGTDSQIWTVAANGTLKVAGGCLATDNDGTANGTLMTWYTCTGDANQRWVYQSDGTLVNTLSGTCLDDPSASTTNGNQLQIYACDGLIQQSWTLP